MAAAGGSIKQENSSESEEDPERGASVHGHVRSPGDINKTSLLQRGDFKGLANFELGSVWQSVCHAYGLAKQSALSRLYHVHAEEG
eukprot:1161370-Pelagomonas_calceolata.AAC.3